MDEIRVTKHGHASDAPALAPQHLPRRPWLPVPGDAQRSTACGERLDGTPFTDRGFEHIPALQHLQPWLADLMAAA